MGPVLLTKAAADGVEWAQSCTQEKLLMVLKGPSAAHRI